MRSLLISPTKTIALMIYCVFRRENRAEEMLPNLLLFVNDWTTAQMRVMIELKRLRSFDRF